MTSATNTRTMLASWVPSWPCGNTAPVLTLETDEAALALLAVLNSMTFDWILRRLVAGLHLNRFYLAATSLPALSGTDRIRLAHYSQCRLAASPRARSLSPTERLPLENHMREAAPTPAEVEAVVCRGYGLGPSDFRRICEENRADRRGLWRYFAATPDAQQIINEGLALLDDAA